VFCYPSLREGFGLPVLEAMAQATAVVTSAGTATEEVAGDAALLIDPHDPATITGALDRLLDDRDLADELGRRGTKRAAELTWRRTAELTAAAYAEVAP
jgi:glycosyltransferase involved in cell wall biosynthesis